MHKASCIMKIKPFESADVQGLCCIIIHKYLYNELRSHSNENVPQASNLLPQGFSSLNHPLERVQFLLYCWCKYVQISDSVAFWWAAATRSKETKLS